MAMKRRASADLSDYWEILLRRRWWVIIPAVLIASGTVAVVYKLPEIYRSQTLILVEPQKVPPDFVKPTVSTDVNSRLQIISQEVLSRTRLQRIIDQFGLYHDESAVDRITNKLLHTGKRTQEDIIEAMRKDITVETIVDEQARDRTLGAFKITYQGYDPALVQQVTREIASLFIEENLKVREQQAEGTNDFIDSELEKSRQALDEQEQRLKNFKAGHMGTLPEQEAANLQLLGQMQSSLQANAEALARAQEQKTYLDSLLSAIDKGATQKVLKAAVQPQLEATRTELELAEQKYTPDHPDVQRLREEVKILEKLSEERKGAQESQEPAPTASAASGPAVPDQLRGQILTVDGEIKRRNKEQADIDNRIRKMQARVESLPAVEQQMSELARDYQISKANYQSLLEKKNASAMAAEMERRAKGEQFRVLDPADYPEKPYKPDVTQLSLLGVLGGILAGCALGLLAEFKDKSINSVKDATFYLELPALASVPFLERSTVEKSNRRRLKGKRPLSVDLKSEPRAPEPEVTAAEPIRAGERLPVVQVLKLEPVPERLVVARNQADDEDEDDAFAREQFRIIRTRLVEVMRVRPIRSVMVTSAVEGEGKTLIAANLAFSMSHLRDSRVLLVDADLRRASLGSFLRMDPPAGLSTFLLNGKNLSDVRWEVSPHLSVVPTRRLQENSAELFNGKRMKDFLDQALQEYDLMVMDAPPILTVADAQVLTSMVDAAILVVRVGSCPHDLARSAAELLQPKVIGMVVNGVTRLPGKRYYYSYYQTGDKSQ
jgi:polysaccharide chain length determinant protein (PEP-CTERM system associated)